MFELPLIERHQRIKGCIVIGLTEEVVVVGDYGEKRLIARVDTGATKSSVDARLAAELRLGPVTRTKMVKSAHGHSLRPAIDATIEIAGKRLTSDFTLADRSNLKYKVLLGQNILKGFLIDPRLP
ncbi:ATP-dependent zinc protease [Candidatus Woesearchaeota archaeon]|nr:ATP-dependent zinc protease [Candidatus Woesearchaeota archaeon]